MSGPTQMDGVELAGAIRSKQVSCREVMAAYLERIGRINPGVNAIVSMVEPELLLRQAEERDAELTRGEYRGWMHGFPQAIKDLAPTKGIVTTDGSPLHRGFVPKEDAIFVERMKRSGAILIGKTNTPEFGLGSQTYNPVFGTTLNAYDRTKTCGGSSGGAAVALALKMLPVADGSDFCGSLRNPAAFNNVIGFRPSFGRVPGGPNREIFVQQLSTDGPMGRTVTDVAMLLSVMAGPDIRAPLSIEQDPAGFAEPLKHGVRGTRIGWLGDLGGHLPFEAGVLDLCRGALKDFEAIGCIVEEARFDYPMESVWQAFVTLRQWMTGGRLHPYYKDPEKRAQMKPEVQWEVEGGLKLSAFQVHGAVGVRSAWYQVVRKLFEKHDFLVLPSAQVFPFDAATPWPREIAGKAMDSYHRWMEVVVPATMSGCPVIGLPAGFGANGLPMGIQVIGPNHADLAVLRIAYAYEQVSQWVAKRPPALG